MDDIYAIRRRNYHRLLDSPPLSVMRMKKDKALALNMSPSMFSQVKHDEYRIGDDLARDIERALNLTPGSLDWRDRSQSVRTDPAIMAEAIYVLQQLGAIQGTPQLASDPTSLSIAYDLISELDRSEGESNVLDITKRLAAKLRGRNEDHTQDKEAG